MRRGSAVISSVVSQLANAANPASDKSSRRKSSHRTDQHIQYEQARLEANDAVLSAHPG